jgi:hypothetical protein
MKIPSIYDFCIAFVKSLLEHKKTILRPSSAASEHDPRIQVDSYNNILQQCLDIAVVQWESLVPKPTGYRAVSHPTQPSSHQKTNRVVELVDLCLLAGHMTPCRKLFALLLKAQGAISEKFKSLYSPLIPRLRELLHAKRTDICSSPFVDLMQLLIASYLRDVLGAKPRFRAKVRKIGCGCADCNEVNLFLRSSAVQQTFRYPQARRTHVERHLTAAADLVEFETIRRGSPHRLAVTKRPDVVTSLKWESRLAKAKVFLNSIGNEDTLSKIMGNRYADVVKALQGTQRFEITTNDAATSTRRVPIVPTTAGAALSNSAEGEVAPIAGQKRKKTLPIISSGSVIDLTGDDSS